VKFLKLCVLLGVVLCGYAVYAVRDRRERKLAAGQLRDLPITEFSPWWLRPEWAAALTLLPATFLAWHLDPGEFRTIWRTPKFFNSTHAFVTLALFGSFVVGAVVAIGGRSRRGAVVADRKKVRTLRRLANVTFWLSVAGYAVWAFLAFARGLSSEELAGVIAGTPGALVRVKYDYLSTVAGVTTLTQLAPIAVVSLICLRAFDRSERIGRKVVVIAVLSLVRSFVHAERLALIEIAVPVLVLLIQLGWASNRRKMARSRRLTLLLAPVWAPVLILLIFGTFEYSRSWQNYYRYKEQRAGYTAFVLQRFEGYYATAANNSALWYDQMTPELPLPYTSMEWFWQFPIVSEQLGYDKLTSVDPEREWRLILRTRANGEFNNAGALLPVASDFGIGGAAVYWLLVGFVVGRAYALYRRSDVRGLLAYPLLATGLFEMGRILYWSQGRAFPSLVALGIAIPFLGRSTVRAPETSGVALAPLTVDPINA
jgi:hypothetical protein